MVDVSHLHFNVIQRVWEAIPDKTDKIARDRLTHMLDYIVIGIRKKLSSAKFSLSLLWRSRN